MIIGQLLNRTTRRHSANRKVLGELIFRGNTIASLPLTRFQLIFYIGFYLRIAWQRINSLRHQPNSLLVYTLYLYIQYLNKAL